MSSRSQRLRQLALGLVPFVALALVRVSVFAEGDTFWGVRTGQQILARHSVHLRDNLSRTRAGVPWHPNEWAYDVALWLAYRVDGIAGLQLLLAATILLLGVVVLAAVRAFRGSVRDEYWAAVFLCPLLLGWLTARAQTVSYGMQLLELLLLARLFTARGRAVWAWAAAMLALQVVWLNIHEAATSGIVVAAGCAVVRGVSLLRSGGLSRRTAAQLAAGPGLVLLGSLCGPFGWSVFSDSEQTRAASAGTIVEWDSIWHAPGLVLAEAAVALVLLLVVVHVWRRERGTELEALSDIWLGAALVLAVATVFVVRFVAPLLLLEIVAVVAAMSTERARALVTRQRRVLDLGATAVALTLAFVGIHDLTVSGEPTSTDFPSARLVDAIPANCQLLNEYDDGGWISLLRWPAVLVSQDGRNVLYGGALLGREQDLLDGRDGVAGLSTFGATCVLAKPTDGIVHELAADPSWALTGRDPERVLYVRRDVATSSATSLSDTSR